MDGNAVRAQGQPRMELAMDVEQAKDTMGKLVHLATSQPFPRGETAHTQGQFEEAHLTFPQHPGQNRHPP